MCVLIQLSNQQAIHRLTFDMLSKYKAGRNVDTTANQTKLN